MNQPLTIK